MKPLNINKESGGHQSSNLIIYQGPDIPCISLCKGDTVTNVIYKLAKKLCAIADELNINNFDLECLALEGCLPKTFKELIELLIALICELRNGPGTPGANGTPGNYVEIFFEAPGANCANGGTRIELYNGVTTALISTQYVCNGGDGEDGDSGIQGPPGASITGATGISGADGTPKTITFDQTSNCEIEVDENAGSPDYNFTLKLQDSGWLDLRGFDHYGPNLSKPKVRKIGNVLHFKGTVVLPLSNDGGATVIPLTAFNSYNNQAYADTYIGTGGVNVNSNGSIVLNKGVSVLPVALNFCSKSIDDSYVKQVISSRQILTGSNEEGVSLSSVFQVIVATTGVMSVQTILDIEQSALGGTAFKGGSPLRYITSKVKAGDFVPDFTTSLSLLHHNSASGSQPAEIDYKTRTYTFDCDAGQPEQIGGFEFRLDGLSVFLT